MNKTTTQSSENFSKKNTVINEHFIEQKKLLDIFILENNLNN